MNSTSSVFLDLLDLEPFLCVMSPSERSAYELALTGVVPAYFTPSQIETWTAVLSERNARVQARFDSAIQKSKKS